MPAIRNRSLILAPDGVELRLAHDRAIAVSADACAAVLNWPDGRRATIGCDGSAIDIEPHHWRDPGGILRHLHAVFPPALHAAMPDRPRAATQLPPRPPEPGRAWAATAGVALLWVLLAGWAGLIVTAMLQGRLSLLPLLLITAAGSGLGGLTARSISTLRETRRALGLTGLPRFSD